MTTIDLIFILSFVGIWMAQIFWIVLSFGAFGYMRSVVGERERLLANLPDDLPGVSVLIPAHNEAVVIEETLIAMARLDYPAERLQVLLINDGSTDETGAIGERIAAAYPAVEVMNVPKGMGGKGKSRTLNVGMSQARGELIAVFDADNTPEPECLLLLVATLLADRSLVAVNGKVRTRNWDASWLTRFVAVEFVYFQWLFQAGRWYWFRLSTLMGTNYVIWRDALDLLGGFDEKSLVDDTEMSLRIFLGKRRIRWVPFAVTWEQEPDTLKVWLKQRARWTLGNLYVTFKYFRAAISHPMPIGLEMLANLLSYIIFLPALMVSHVVFVLGILQVAGTQVSGPFGILWGVSFLVFTLQMWFALSVERERPWTYVLAALSYVTYAQLFIPVTIMAISRTVRSLALRQEMKWDKTQRTKETP